MSRIDIDQYKTAIRSAQGVIRSPERQKYLQQRIEETKKAETEAAKPLWRRFFEKETWKGIGKDLRKKETYKQFPRGVASSLAGAAIPLSKIGQRLPIGVSPTIIPSIKRRQERGIEAIKRRLAMPEGRSPQEQIGYQAGQFAGSTVPYMLGYQAGGAITKIPSVAARLGKFAPLAGEAIGWAGTGQVLHKPEEGSRLKRLGIDLATLGLFKGAGKGVGLIKKGVGSKLGLLGEVGEYAGLQLPQTEKPAQTLMEKLSRDLKVFRGVKPGETKFRSSEVGPYRKFGFSVTEDKQIAKRYADLAKEYAPAKKGEGLIEGLIGKGAKVKELGKRGINEIEPELGRAKKQGYDILRFTGKETGEKEIVVLNQNIIKQIKLGLPGMNKIIGKQRGFIETISKSKQVSPELGKILKTNPEAYYGVRHNPRAIDKAQKLIFNNLAEAERIAKTETSDDAIFTAAELVKRYSEQATKAKARGDIIGFNKSMDKAVDISIESAKNLTEHGRAVQAASTINRLSPDGIIKFINRTITKAGGKARFTNEEYAQIINKANAIQAMTDPKARAMESFSLLDDIYSKVPRSVQDKIYETLNIPRAMMTTADFSAGLRQGIFYATRHPIKFAKAFTKQFKYAFSEKAYLERKAEIMIDPDYALAVKNKLPLSDYSKGLSAREEKFASSYAEKIPLIGRIVKGSNRAYTGLLNDLRWGSWKDFIKTGKQLNLKGAEYDKYLESVSRFIGASTGRGQLPKLLEGTQKILNATVFAPRLVASRVQLLNPLFYIKLHPAVRKEALKSLLAFIGTGAGVLSLAKLGGAEVGTDPRSADFAKAKVGNTRYDVLGGFQQYMVLYYRLLSGQMVSSTTGREFNLGEGYRPTTRADIALRFLESKEAPVASFIYSVFKGTNFQGRPIDIPAEIANRFFPMVASDMYDLYKEQGLEGIPMGIPAIFGMGVQTYGQQIPVKTKTATGAETLGWRERPELGESILNKLIGRKITEVPQQFWKPLEKERAIELKEKAAIDNAKRRVLETGESMTVGNKYIYLENGVVKTKTLEKKSYLPLKKKYLETGRL